MNVGETGWAEFTEGDQQGYYKERERKWVQEEDSVMGD